MARRRAQDSRLALRVDSVLLPLVLPPAATGEATRAVTLRTRATDASGAVQPEQIIWNRLGYGNNAIRACTIHVVS